MAYTSIQKVVEASFLGVSWQMCLIRCIGAVLRNISWNTRKRLAEGLKEAYANEQKLQDIADNQNTQGYQNAVNTEVIL